MAMRKSTKDKYARIYALHISGIRTEDICEMLNINLSTYRRALAWARKQSLDFTKEEQLKDAIEGTKEHLKFLRKQLKDELTGHKVEKKKIVTNPKTGDQRVEIQTSKKVMAGVISTLIQEIGKYQRQLFVLQGLLRGLEDGVGDGEEPEQTNNVYFIGVRPEKL